MSKAFGKIVKTGVVGATGYGFQRGFSSDTSKPLTVQHTFEPINQGFRSSPLNSSAINPVYQRMDLMQAPLSFESRNNLIEEENRVSRNAHWDSAGNSLAKIVTPIRHPVSKLITGGAIVGRKTKELYSS